MDWKKFRDLIFLLATKNFSLGVKDKFYNTSSRKYDAAE